MRKLLSILSATALLSACCGSGKPGIIILHTNDTHSHIEAERSGELAGHGGAIERAAFIDSVRRAEGADRVLLLHAGDFNQGTSYYNRFGGKVEAELVNAMGYDCITLGNHEFDNGIEDLASRLATIKCPVVCANLDLSACGLKDLVKPCAIIKKNGLKIGIIGLETESSSTMKRNIAEQIKMLDSQAETDKWAEYLKKNEKCNLVIVLSHLGYERDQELASACSNIDLVVGGHTHTFIDEPEYINKPDGKSVPVVTDGCWGLEMGKISVNYE